MFIIKCLNVGEKVLKRSDINLPQDGCDYSEGKRSTKVTGGINITSSFTDILERQYLPFDIYVRKAIVKFSVKKIKRHGKFSAFLINRLDIFRMINLLLWKKKLTPILHAYVVLNST